LRFSSTTLHSPWYPALARLFTLFIELVVHSCPIYLRWLWLSLDSTGNSTCPFPRSIAKSCQGVWNSTSEFLVDCWLRSPPQNEQTLLWEIIWFAFLAFRTLCFACFCKSVTNFRRFSTERSEDWSASSSVVWAFCFLSRFQNVALTSLRNLCGYVVFYRSPAMIVGSKSNEGGFLSIAGCFGMDRELLPAYHLLLWPTGCSPSQQHSTCGILLLFQWSPNIALVFVHHDVSGMGWSEERRWKVCVYMYSSRWRYPCSRL